MTLKNDWEAGDAFSASDANAVADAVNAAAVAADDVNGRFDGLTGMLTSGEDGQVLTAGSSGPVWEDLPGMRVLTCATAADTALKMVPGPPPSVGEQVAIVFTNGNTVKANVNLGFTNDTGYDLRLVRPGDLPATPAGEAIVVVATGGVDLRVVGAISDKRLIPAGGTDGKVLTSNASGVAEWKDAPAGGGTPGVVVTGPYQSGQPNDAGPVVPPTSNKDGQVTLGTGASNTGNLSVVAGQNAKTSQSTCVSIGFNSTSGTTGSDAVAVGAFASSAGSATAVGGTARANHNFSTALGNGSATTKADQIMLGKPTQVVTMPGKAEIGTGLAMVTLSTRITGGKAELIAQFANGDPVVIATEP